MKRSLKFLAVIAVAALPLAAQAHKAFLLPSSTVLTESDHKITVDAAVSNDLFYFNHAPMRLDDLQITAPDGSSVAPENVATGAFRSVFDVPLAQAGTYRIASVSSGMFANWTEDGKPHRWRGSAEAFKTEVPVKAKDLRVMQMANRVETFVTVGKPSLGALATNGAGLELVPITHPNDLYVGEAATFKLLLDGKPAADLKVTVIPGATRYRDQVNEITTRTNADGVFAVTWPQAGMYWLNASLGGGREGKGEDDDNDGKGEPDVASKARSKPAPVGGERPRRVGYSATFEVLP